jgi:hypothetical protein
MLHYFQVILQMQDQALQLQKSTFGLPCRSPLLLQARNRLLLLSYALLSIRQERSR